MAKKEKLEAPKAPRGKVARSEKVARRLNGVSAKTPFKMAKAVFGIEAIAKVPVSVQGFIVEQNKDTVAFRHKRTSASKRMVVTVFNTSDILELFGVPGEPAELTVLMDQTIRKAQGTIVSSTGNGVTIQTVSGEQISFYRTAGVKIHISAEDEEGSQPSNRGPKSSKKAPVVDIKSGGKKKKKRSDDDDDDDL